MITARPITEAWTSAEPALRKMCSRLGLDNALPDYLFDLCLNRKAWLYTCSEADAFAIVQHKISNQGVISMYVWAACNCGSRRITTEQGEAYLDELARGMKATEIWFFSCRKGFRRSRWKQHGKMYSRSVREA